MSVIEALQNFLASSYFELVVEASTKASGVDKNFFVELFDDGSFRVSDYKVLDYKNLVNAYESEVILLRVPCLSEDEIDSGDYYNARYEIREAFEEKWGINLQDQHRSVVKLIFKSDTFIQI